MYRDFHGFQLSLLWVIVHGVEVQVTSLGLRWIASGRNDFTAWMETPQQTNGEVIMVSD